MVEIIFLFFLTTTHFLKFSFLHIKQIEVNIGPMGGNLTERVTEFHRRVLSKAGIATPPEVLPINKPTNTMAQGLYLAW